MSPVRRHFWQVVARVNSSFPIPINWFLNWFIPAGVKSTVGSPRGTSSSLGRRTHPLLSKKARKLSRSSSVFMGLQRSQIHNAPLSPRERGWGEGRGLADVPFTPDLYSGRFALRGRGAPRF